MDARTTRATTFCIALMAAQIAPSSGALRAAWMTPPVTMSAVPMVSSTKPQKIPACIRPARGSLNILVWTNAYCDEAGQARRQVVDGRRGPGRREDPQVAGHGQHEEGGGAPEDREDERVGRDGGERLEHQRGGSPWAGRVTS